MGVLQDLKDNLIGTDEQNSVAQANLDKQARQGSGLARMLGGDDRQSGQAYVGSRLNMPSNTRLGKLNPEDTRLLNKYDRSEEGVGARLKRDYGMKKGGKVKKMSKGDKVSSASSRADGCCERGKTKGRFV